MARAAAVLLAGMFGAALVAQQPPERPFRRQVEGVQLDVRVVDRDGRFVRDLTKDDLTVLEEGKEQTISSLDLVEIPIVDAAPPPGAIVVDPDVSTNAITGQGRIYLIVLDDLHTHALRTPTVQAIARDFIDRLGPTDSAALIATSGRRQLATEFTNRRGRLLDAASRFEGGFAAGARCASGAAPCLADEHTAITYLTTLSKWMAGLDARRKALVFISEGFDSGLPEALSGSGAPGGRAGDLSSFGDAAMDLRETIDAAARSDVAIYAIDPRGLPTGPVSTIKPVTTLAGENLDESRADQQTLEILSEETGGSALVRSNAFAAEFDRIVSDSSAYYLIGYTSNNSGPDGQFRRIQVRSRRPGLVVQTRTGYVARTPKPPAAAANPTKPGELTPALADALSSPIQIAGLTLTMTAAPFRGEKSNASVAVVVEAAGGELPLSVAIVAADPDGKIKGQEHGTLDVKAANCGSRNADCGASGAGPSAAAQTDRTLRLASRIALSPGRYQLRAAGVDREGVTGSVHFDLDVPDFSKGSLTMSGLQLASSSAASSPTAGTDRRGPQRPGVPPTTTRTFAAGDRVTLFAEVYDNGKSGDTIEVSTSVAGETGQTPFTSVQKLAPPPGRKGKVALEFTETVPLTDLRPGAYVVTVDARRLGRGTEHAAQRIPIAIR